MGGPGAQWGKRGEGGTLHIEQQGSACGGFRLHREPARPGGNAWKRQRAVSCVLSTAVFPTTFLGKASLTDEETGLDR